MSQISSSVTDVSSIFHIKETQCWGVPDNFYDKTVLHTGGQLPIIPSLQKLQEDCVSALDYYYILERQQWVGFYWTSCQERAMGPCDETCHGPFLVPGKDAPKEKDLANAISCCQHVYEHVGPEELAEFLRAA